MGTVIESSKQFKDVLDVLIYEFFDDVSGCTAVRSQQVS